MVPARFLTDRELGSINSQAWNLILDTGPDASLLISMPSPKFESLGRSHAVYGVGYLTKTLSPFQGDYKDVETP